MNSRACILWHILEQCNKLGGDLSIQTWTSAPDSREEKRAGCSDTSSRVPFILKNKLPIPAELFLFFFF